jgi:hypothetical protein
MIASQSPWDHAPGCPAGWFGSGRDGGFLKTEIREMNATRRLSLGAVMVGVLIGVGRTSEASFITYTLGGIEGTGFYLGNDVYQGVGIDPVSISMTVDTSTIVNDPANSALSPGYVTGSALATVSVSDRTYGELTTTLMAHVEVSQVYSTPWGTIGSGPFTGIQFIADTGPSLGSSIGKLYFDEMSGFALPVTYDLKSPIQLVGIGLIAYGFQTPGGTLDTGIPGNRTAPNYTVLSFQATAVPEPSSLALSGIAGVAGLAVARARRRRPS